MAFLFGAKTLAESRELIKQINLKPVIEKIRTPLLLSNGKDDQLLPYTDALKIKEEARCPVEAWVFEGGGLHCGKMWHRVFSMESEYLKEKLS